MSESNLLINKEDLLLIFLCQIALYKIWIHENWDSQANRRLLDRLTSIPPYHKVFCFIACKQWNGLGLYGQVTKRARWMPWHLEAMKDVVACDKRWEGGKQPVIQRSLNGETHPLWVSCTEYIGARGKPGELKHLSTPRKRNQPRFP